MPRMSRALPDHGTVVSRRSFWAASTNWVGLLRGSFLLRQAKGIGLPQQPKKHTACEARLHKPELDTASYHSLRVKLAPPFVF